MDTVVNFIHTSLMGELFLSSWQIRVKVIPSLTWKQRVIISKANKRLAVHSSVLLLVTSKLVGDQSSVEQSTTSGAIYACVVTNGGSGYTDKLTCSIVGDGEGAIAEAIRGDTQETQDKIVAIRMLRWGKNYTYANVVFEDPGRSKVDETIDAEAYAILPPVGGHGKNAIDELYADTFSVYVNIRDEGWHFGYWARIPPIRFDS